ncbi:MAG: T9SS type A sorting domain-containing protein [Bacteroidota bacterium]
MKPYRKCQSLGGFSTDKTKSFIAHNFRWLILFITLLAHTQLLGQPMALPTEACTKNCLTYADIEDQEVDYNGNRQRLAYSLEDFLSLSSTDISTANTECVVGIYSRYALGLDLEKLENDEFPWMLLISHPYNASESTPDADTGLMLDKADSYSGILREMCFEPVDEGWISIANWGKLDPSITVPAFRMTNGNYSELGRVSKGTEYLMPSSPGEAYLQDETVREKIFASGRLISTIIGPNIPVPGYDEGIYPNLKRMIETIWTEEESANRKYFQDANLRGAYEVFINDEEKLTDLIGNEIFFEGDPEVIYALDCMGRLYISNADNDPELRRISQFLGGGAVAAAGRIVVDDGDVQFLGLNSLEYRPPSAFLSRLTDKFPNVLFETPFDSFLEPFGRQTWRCGEISVSAPISGREPGILETRYDRKFQVPAAIETSSIVANGLTVTIELVLPGGVVDFSSTLNYIGNPTSTRAYDFLSGDLEVGDITRFNRIEIQASMSNDMGQATLSIRNCQDCLLLPEVRGNRSLAGRGETTETFYTLEEFVRNALPFLPDDQFDPPFDPSSVANLECMTGSYGRYNLGYSKEKSDNGQYPWLMLVSHPYSASEAAPILNNSEGKRMIFDKASDFPDVLEQMCYEAVDEGWISVARWGLLDPAVTTNAIRFTNGNYSEAGRITPQGEFLAGGSPTDEFLEAPGTAMRLAEIGIPISRLIGPNFPTPDFKENQFGFLKTLELSQWTFDEGLQQKTPLVFNYIQDPAIRMPYEVKVSPDGRLRDANGALVETLNGYKNNFVIDCMGRMYLTNMDDPSSLVRLHSQFLAGGAVAAAGEVQTDRGVIEHVNLRSGHYEPPAPLLSRVQDFFPDASFEDSYPNPDFDYEQSWVCSTIMLNASVDGTEVGAYAPRLDEFPRLMILPESISVTSGSATGRLELQTLARSVIDDDPIPIPSDKIVYVPNPSNPSQYRLSATLSDGVVNPGDSVFFFYLTMAVKDGGTGRGRASLLIDNCAPSSSGLLGSPDVIASISAEDNHIAYPNPGRDRVFVQFDKLTLVKKLHFITLDGKRYYPSWSLEGHTLSIDTKWLEPQVYYLQIETNQGPWEEKVIIQD